MSTNHFHGLLPLEASKCRARNPLRPPPLPPISFRYSQITITLAHAVAFRLSNSISRKPRQANWVRNRLVPSVSAGKKKGGHEAPGNGSPLVALVVKLPCPAVSCHPLSKTALPAYLKLSSVAPLAIPPVIADNPEEHPPDVLCDNQRSTTRDMEPKDSIDNNTDSKGCTAHSENVAAAVDSTPYGATAEPMQSQTQMEGGMWDQR